MPARRPDPRKRKTLTRTNFNLKQEAVAMAIKTGKGHTARPVEGDLTRTYPKAFGTREMVKNAECIGTVTGDGGKAVHWHVDRRGKKGTVEDRKK